MATIKEQYDEAITQLTQEGSPFSLGQKTVDGVSYKVFDQAAKNLPDIYAEARAHGDKDFIVYEGERWSFNDVFKQADAIGYQLLNDLGVEKGDRVAIAMRNYPEWITSFIAITSIGAVVVPLNSWGQAKELEYALTDAGAKVVFCDQQRLDYIADRLPALGIQAIVARPTAAAVNDSIQTLEDFTAGLDEQTMPQVEIAGEELGLMMYTSGTTGNPKGAVSSQHAVCQALTAFEVSGYAHAMSNPEALETLASKGYEPAQMLAVPLFHVSGCYAVFLLSLKAGRRIVMMYKWDAQQALQLIEQERVTVLSAAPTMIMEMLELPEFDPVKTHSLWNVGGGGSATPPRAAQLILEKVDAPYPGTGWGMTESNAVGASFTGQAFQYKPGSAGFVAPVVDIEIRDSDGNLAEPGEAGILWIKSPTLIKEYWNKPEANAKDFKEGWFDSGDIGYFDEEGYLFLSDRAKDMIIRGGENIYPAEIEAVLFDHPEILEATVFGLPDSRMGEQVAACIKPRPGSNVEKDAIKDFARQHLAGFKVPHYVWIHNEELPKNASGKVLKKDLKEAMINNLGLRAD
ncbi:MAG: class I adenylate-forming enzyme family protein [Pseudomonadales bacterium]